MAYDEREEQSIGDMDSMPLNTTHETGYGPDMHWHE